MKNVFFFLGMVDYFIYLCFFGFYCLFGQESILCLAGRMRDIVGVVDYIDCDFCRFGYYCFNDIINIQGIFCRVIYECFTGFFIEFDCRLGYYCLFVIGVSFICFFGYYCLNVIETFILCIYLFYCFEGSNMILVCDFGNQVLIYVGIRYDKGLFCRICFFGYYGNFIIRVICEFCLVGFYCLMGIGYGNINFCLIGIYCSIGFDYFTNCFAGYRGEKFRAESYYDCYGCLVGTYSDIEVVIYCKFCGSFFYFIGNSFICICIGKYRFFQKLVGLCVCLTGYIYYDETDIQKIEENSDEDCQQIVDIRCTEYEVRFVFTRQCVFKESVDCYVGCDILGYFDVEFGVYVKLIYCFL